MPYSIDQQINTGSFVPTTNVWDTSEIYELTGIDDDFRNLLVRLYQNLNLMSEVLNSKDTAAYLTQQFVSGQLYFNPASTDVDQRRPGFRVLIDTGALAAGANVTPLAFTIPGRWTFFKCHGAATNSTTPVSYPLPFASASGTNNIEVILNATTIAITNNSGVTFNRSSVILEFVKN